MKELTDALRRLWCWVNDCLPGVEGVPSGHRWVNLCPPGVTPCLYCNRCRILRWVL